MEANSILNTTWRYGSQRIDCHVLSRTPSTPLPSVRVSSCAGKTGTPPWSTSLFVYFSFSVFYLGKPVQLTAWAWPHQLSFRALPPQSPPGIWSLHRATRVGPLEGAWRFLSRGGRLVRVVFPHARCWDVHCAAFWNLSDSLHILDKYEPQEAWGTSGPQLLVSGPSGLFDFVLHTLWALRPWGPRIMLIEYRQIKKLLYTFSILFCKSETSCIFVTFSLKKAAKLWSFCHQKISDSSGCMVTWCYQIEPTQHEESSVLSSKGFDRLCMVTRSDQMGFDRLFHSTRDSTFKFGLLLLSNSKTK